MSEQTLIEVAASPGPPAEFGTGREGSAQPLRMLGLAAVCLGVAALAAATFVLSYAGIHAVVRQAGISPRYASDYPVLIDAMLVIALLAVLGLRGAGIPSRILAWLTLLAVLAAAAGADALHATGHTLPHNVGAATAAILPWALVLLAFVLLLTLLRHARLRRHASGARRRQAAQASDRGRSGAGQQVAAHPTPLPVRVPQQWTTASATDSASIVPGLSSRLVSSAAAGAAAGAADEPPGLTAEAGVASEPNADHTEPEPVPVEAASAMTAEAGTADQLGAQPAGEPGLAGAPGTATAADTGTATDTSTAADVETAADDTDAVPADDTAAAADDTAAAAGDTAAAAGDTDAVPDAAGDASLADTDAAAEGGRGEPGGADEGPADASSPAAHGDAEAGDPPAAGTEAAELAPADEETDESLADDMPVFHRMWSTPTPPES